MCIEIGDQLANAEPFAVTFFEECDPWVMPHLINVFLLYILFRNAMFVYFISALWEVIEVVFVVLFGNFVIFAGQTNFFFENIANSLLLDFFIQATLGIILGKVYVMVFDPPPLITGWKRRDNAIYVVWIILTVIPQSLYDLYDVDLNLPYGAMITVLVSSLFILILVFWEPNKKKWNSKAERLAFWGTSILLDNFTLAVGHIKAPWVPSTAILSWWLWGIYMFICIALLAADSTLGKELRNWVKKLLYY